MEILRTSTSILKPFALMWLLLVPFQAHATMMTSFSETTSLSSSSEGTDDFDISEGSITLPAFDTSLGTLTSAEVLLRSDYRFDAGGSVSGRNDVELDGLAFANFYVDIALPLTTATSFNYLDGFDLICSGTDSCSDFNGSDGSFNDTTGVIIDTDDLTAFSFPIDIWVDLTTEVRLTSCEGTDASCSLDVSANWDPITATVNYTYEEATAVPPPSTLALLSLGFVGFAFGLRRR